jgi:large subunit ribosomal protein L3
VKGLLARKLGMTQLFNPDGTISAVTVLEAGPCRVLGLRTTEKDGYSAVRIAFEPIQENKLNQPQKGQFKKANLEPHRHIVEIRNYDGVEAGQELKAEIFAAGELVDVTSTSKGKGFQ